MIRDFSLPTATLIDQGFCVRPGQFSLEDLESLRDSLAARCKGEVDSKGVAITLSVDLNDPAQLQLVQQATEILASETDTEIEDMRYVGGAVIPKYPNEPRRRWHVDWWNWSEEADTTRVIPPQAGVIFYLDHGLPETGALTCMPYSHRTLHEDTRSLLGTGGPHPEEYTIPVVRGTAVAIDARLLHCVTSNKAADRTRIAVTLWFLLDWPRLSEGTRAGAMACVDPANYSLLGTLQPDYSGWMPGTPHIKDPFAR